MDGEVDLVLLPFGQVMDIYNSHFSTIFSMECMGMVISIQEIIMAMVTLIIYTETIIMEGEIIHITL